MGDRIPRNEKKPLLIILMLCIGFLFVAASALGISFPHARYPTPELYNAFLPNDYANLLVCIPLLVVSTVNFLRDRSIGLIGWYASLLFIVYNSIAYATDLRNTLYLTIYMVIILVGSTELVLLVRSPATRSLVPTEFPVRHPRLYGLIPVIMGLLFEIRALIIIFSMVSKDATKGMQGLGVHIADTIISLVWIVSGALLLLGRKMGYPMVLITYLHGSLLFVALLVYLCLKPLLCDTTFIAMDVIVTGVMGLLFFLPTVRVLSKSLKMPNS
ncbi:hypothetical protein SpiGrapes_0509 [Sphaerochaeta pleomorpha str. Grapes]|uniref:Uncharacterized protein n=1 Tax=Sphaerochaeta pleomorpha (strain ATCC BAA-1885 / DSM 22778 / Grapes) TaxID=158190 RepID=G8QWR9_SPHPG|nr:hypothetical protein [Sphaerochaeta pleomorpha]AEV28363.1 hypothetical protein SpiGrapes_0509 [Sphaerochaeta pleomorpha str. Grapes]